MTFDLKLVKNGGLTIFLFILKFRLPIMNKYQKLSSTISSDRKPQPPPSHELTAIQAKT